MWLSRSEPARMCLQPHYGNGVFGHSMSSSCEFSTKEIRAAFFGQTFWAELEWFRAAFSTATVQLNVDNVKPDILSLIFSSWNSLFAKNENYKT